MNAGRAVQLRSQDRWASSIIGKTVDFYSIRSGFESLGAYVVTTNKGEKMKRIVAVFGIVFALLVGFAVAPNGGTAQALGGFNLVNNAGYSNQAILVCGGDCHLLNPSESAYEGSYWMPEHVAVCRYCVAQFRAVVGNSFTTNWVRQEGGRYGTWINSGDIIRFWGGQDVMVQVVMTGPYY